MLNYSKIGTPENLSNEVSLKLNNNIIFFGFSALANKIIDKIRILNAQSFKIVLKDNILIPLNRFSQDSKNVRNMLRFLCQNATTNNISIIEGLWREVITDNVLERCSKFNVSVMSLADLGIQSDLLVEKLIHLLDEVRYISRTDMAVTNQCCMSADFAFLVAFRRYFFHVCCISCLKEIPLGYQKMFQLN
jgi:hypothetical protein